MSAARGAALVLVAAFAPACAEAPRFTAWRVDRAPHPDWGSGAPSSAGPVADDSWREAGPPAVAASGATPIGVVETALADGARLWTLRRTSQPVARVRIVVARGTSDAPAEAPLAAAMLFAGTAHNDRRGLSQSLAAMGAYGSATATEGAVVVDAAAPSWNLSPALDLLFEVLRTPSFPEDELPTARVRRPGAVIDWRSSDPASIAEELLQAELYPAPSPFHEVRPKDHAALDAVRREDLATWWRSVAVPSLTTVLVAGDVDPEAAAAKVRTLAADWSAPAAAARVAPPPPPAPAGPRVVLVDRPADPVVTVRLGWTVADEASPDLAAVRLLVSWIGSEAEGSPERVWRDERGAAARVRAWVSPRPGASELVIAAALERAQAVEAAGDIASRVERLASEPIDDARWGALRAASPDLVGEALETSASALAALTAPAVEGEPLSAFWERLGAPRTIDRDAVQRALARNVTRASRVLVVLGDAATLRAPLAAADLGAVVVAASR